jgi:hypothetical protein
MRDGPRSAGILAEVGTASKMTFIAESSVVRGRYLRISSFVKFYC